MAKTKGLSGIAVAMVGAGALAIYSAIQGTSPIEILRSMLAGKRPEPLGTQARGTAIQAPGGSPTYQGPGGKGGKVVSKAGLKPHVAAEAEFAASTWNTEVQGFAFRNIAGTNTLSDHARGLAIDIMVPPGVQGRNIGDAAFNHYIQNAERKRVKYIIWQHTIWSDTRGSQRYGKNDHLNHVHISFYPIGSARAI
jgi:hypothetical protein